MYVLLVDDNSDALATAQDELRSLTKDCLRATSVEEAFQRIDEHGTELDVAVVDMFMGDDTEAGLKVVAHLSERYPWVSAVVWTGFADLRNAAKCMEVGGFSYVPKSDANLLRQTVVRAAERSASKRHFPVVTRQVYELDEAMQQSCAEFAELANRVRLIRFELQRWDAALGNGNSYRHAPRP